MSNDRVGFPEYGMTKTSNFWWGLPPASNPQRAREKGAFIYGAKAKNIVKSSIGFYEYGMTSASHFRWSLPLPATPQE